MSSDNNPMGQLLFSLPSGRQKTEDQRAQVTCLRSHSQWAAGPGLEPRQRGSRACRQTPKSLSWKTVVMPWRGSYSYLSVP